MKVVNIVVENAVVTDVAELSVVLVLTGDVGPEELSNLVGVYKPYTTLFSGIDFIQCCHVLYYHSTVTVA